MPARPGGGLVAGTTRRKHSLGNLRRAYPASGATWNVQVVRGKMSSKCLWHACRALVLGLTLMLLGVGMATLGYYADQLSMGTELRGNTTVRVKNDLKGFHLNNFSYVGPIVMGFGGFIVVASCVMTFEARDSAAKVVPARLRATSGSKTTVRSNQSSSASQRRAAGLQLQSMRWDQSFGGVFRTPTGLEPKNQNHQHQHQTQSIDREALTAELIKFSKSLSASARFSPQLRRLTYTGSVPNLSIHVPHPITYSTNISHLLSPHHKTMLLEHKHHHRHHHHHSHRRHHRHNYPMSSITSMRFASSSGRQVKTRSNRNSNSLIQRTSRDPIVSCTLLQPPSNRLLWHAASFDESARLEKPYLRSLERTTKRSDTAKRHVLSRQKPIEHDEERTNHRRSSTMSDSSYSGRWTARCASIASQASSVDSRRIQVDLHSPEILPKSILRSPKRYNSGPSATSSVEKEFRSQLSVCSEPPPNTIRQLSGQSSLEPCLPEENFEIFDNKQTTSNSNSNSSNSNNNHTTNINEEAITKVVAMKKPGILKKSRPDNLPITAQNAAAIRAILNKTSCSDVNKQNLQRSNSSRTFYRPKPQRPSENDDSIFYIRSSNEKETTTIITSTSADNNGSNNNDFYDSLKVINERRTTLLRVESETALNERKASNICLMQEIPERPTENQSQSQSQSQSTSIEIENLEARTDVVIDVSVNIAATKLIERNDTTYQVEENKTAISETSQK